jgi:predicted PurR-regulated permease PerM
MFLGPNARIRSLFPELETQIKRWLGDEKAVQTLQTLQQTLEGHTSSLYSLLGQMGSFLGSAVLQGAQGFLTFLSFLILVPVYAFFALLTLEKSWREFEGGLPHLYRDKLVATFRKIHRANAAFFRGQMAIAAIKAALGALGLWIVGVPFSLFLGLLYGVASLFPFVGVTLTFGVVELLVIATFGFSSKAILAAAVLVAIEGIEGFLLQPLILGRQTGLSPLWTILSFFIFGELFGLFGLILAVPLATISRILIEEYVLPFLRTRPAAT